MNLIFWMLLYITQTFINNSEKGKDIKINTELAKMYIKELKQLAKEGEIIDNINVTEVIRLPEVLNISLENDDEELILSELTVCTKNAIDSFIAMRETEGLKIKEDLQNRINIISKKIDKINSISTGLVEEYVVKLEKRINDILKTSVVDETRLAQEIVIYSDKCSIEEEITRLRSHILQFTNLLEK